MRRYLTPIYVLAMQKVVGSSPIIRLKKGLLRGVREHDAVFGERRPYLRGGQRRSISMEMLLTVLLVLMIPGS